MISKVALYDIEVFFNNTVSFLRTVTEYSNKKYTSFIVEWVSFIKRASRLHINIV